jgi:leucyl-tRNA synthetase
VPLSAGREDVRQQVYALPKIREQLQGKQVVRDVYVPGRIYNLVTH